ncbi:MAG: alpha-amylase family glycosyl hydrolase [Ignavibacteria bacterium]|jgi:glycosidase|nr:alpha-amylase family glycosyl hydrolase [Ignavibacteria bacterium]MDH7526830.1 alpha-amylase family glycosyl hydrolase [Ignavibacteria bacterium]
MNHKLVYQIDIREFFFRHKSKNSGIKNLLDLPSEFFDEIKSLGVEFLWLLGIYEPSQASREISISMTELHKKYSTSLLDWKEDDVIGSPYAITSYKISKEFGGEEVYKKFREKIKKNYKLKTILDFVPNHLAIDSPVVQKHPEFFIQATEDKKNKCPEDYIKINIMGKEYIFAHGREPYSPVWKDTLQLDYRSKSVREFMIKELLKLSKKCDGVRCDMSMLLLSDIFFDNWKDYPLPKDYVPAAQEFWYDAISKVKKENPDFVFIAEVYWHRENDLLELGFDFVYDKLIYELLIDNRVDLINEYIKKNFSYQKNRFLFLENHDEQRSAHIFSDEKLKAVATLIYTLPSMKLIYDGQLEGKEFHHAIQLRRLQNEEVNSELKNFYKKLFNAIKNSSIPKAYFKLLKPVAAWEGNPGFFNFIIYLYEDEKFRKDLVVINLSPYQSQCKVKVDSYDLIGKKFLIKDRLSDEEYIRDGNEMFYNGLYLDVKPYQSQIFEFIKVEQQ